MSVIGSNILAGASGQGGGYNLTRSLRLRLSATAFLNRTPASATDRQKFTWSGWIKRGSLGIYGQLFSARNSDNNNFGLLFWNDDTLYFADQTAPTYNLQFKTTQVFRDPSAWYHVVLAIDTTQATNTNRVKLYVNGSQVTAFSTATYPSQNLNTYVNTTNAHNIGAFTANSNHFDGYMTEVNFIDGQALTPSSFGETSATTGVWQPKKYAGTYGTNGFYLPMNKAVPSYNADYLVIAGGGGGSSGGGGAGGMLTGTTELISGLAYTVTVGAGGAGTGAGGTRGANGANSVFNSITAIGGGGGGANTGQQDGASGGSGGGGGYISPSTNGVGGASTSGQGNAGGTSSIPTTYGSGGGGAGEAGNTDGSGQGGDGLASSITGSSVTYAGGGGGIGDLSTSPVLGGTGGGGNGNIDGAYNGGAGDANTGGGGGGRGGNGGSGVVILRILTSLYTGTTTGSPTVTTDGSYTVVKYTSSGSYTA